MTFAWLSAPVAGQAADGVAGLRTELQALKKDYETRTDALEARIKQLESMPISSAPAEATAAAQPPAPNAGTPASATAFNPAISVILGGNYTDTSRDPADWHIGGFIPSGGEVGPGERSFNLGESELALSANIDPYFSGTMIAALTGQDTVEIEEAYFRTLALAEGFTAKGGRFFSGFGYLNEVHAHAWDFADQPLVYQAFWGNQFKQNGVQVKWLAPTDLFLEVGVEGGNGEAFPATRRNRNGLNGATLFAHVGGDIGDSTSWRAGGAWIDQRADDRTYKDMDEFGVPVVDAFTGKSQTWVVDGVLKWTPYGNVLRQQLKVQGEYMRRRESGQLTFDADGLGLTDAYRTEQSGWYLQSVFQFLPRWRAGLRYDALDSGTPRIGLVSSGLLSPEAFPLLRSADPDRISIMVDWSPSEFSRLRAQYDFDNARDEGSRDRVLRLQYLYSLGVHGAHKF